MGVKGKGLRADGLHKQYMNGSPHDSNTAVQGKFGGPSGGTVKGLQGNGQQKSYVNGSPIQSGPVTPRGSGSAKFIGNKNGE